MQIGISLIEYMTIAVMVTGVLWLVARSRKAAIERSGKKPWWVSFGADFFGVLALVLVCRVAIADWEQVPSGSMEPNLRVGDRILVNKLAYGPRLPFTNTAIKFGDPERGDVVVFRYPEDVSQLFVKRLIGLPNDIVSYHDGNVTINRQPFQLKPVSSVVPRKEDAGQSFYDETAGSRERIIKLDSVDPGASIDPIAWREQYHAYCTVFSIQDWECKVPQGKYLMMGDNRDNSKDSRVWGFLDQDQVYGKAVKVIVNFSDFSRFWLPL
ncbi:MAG TPA: signal peptidase I [Burkholderiaceae bacterium]|jgi:signal peptidase I